MKRILNLKRGDLIVAAILLTMAIAAVLIYGARSMQLLAAGLCILPLLGTVAPPAADPAEIQKQLGEIGKEWGGVRGSIKTLTDGQAEIQKGQKTVTDNLDALQKSVDEMRRKWLIRQNDATRRPGGVSDECARHLAAIAIGARLKSGREITPRFRDIGERLIKEVLGVDQKAALTTSEIPLPEAYSGEVVELVDMYGMARRYGTVFPLGDGTVQLPKLSTSPAFGLIAASATVTEKAPAVAFVEFNAKKWGGLVRVPREIEDDSIVAMGQFLARYAAREMAKIEDVVFWTADGSGTYASLSGLIKAFDGASTRVVLGSTETANSATDLADVRAMRTKVASAVLGRGAYFFHPSFEQLFNTFNTAGDKPYNANGIQGATLDGFPIHWIDVLPVYSTSAAASTVYGVFGDPSYTYLGIRGGMRFDQSADAAFETDEILVRALERFTIGHMAANHVSVIKTAAS